MKNIYARNIIKAENGSLFSELYAQHNGITGETITDLYSLRGEKVRCCYSEIFFNDSNMILCNDITKVSEYWFDNIENGSVEYYEDNNGNIYTPEEAEEKKDEIEREIEELEAEIEALEDEAEIEELESMIEAGKENIEALENEHWDEIFQFFIIDDSTAEHLKEHTNEIIIYIPELDVYVLGVTHYGTSWDYVGTEYTL